MKILAIDPGNKQSAYVVLDGLRIIWHGIVPNESMRSMLLTLNDGIGHSVDVVAIEMIQSFGMAVGAEVFETVFWIGRFFEASPVPAHRVFRGEVKLHLCGSMRAKDPNIRQRLIDKLGPQGTKAAKGPTYGIAKDCWSALAVGVTWLETRQAAATA